MAYVAANTRVNQFNLPMLYLINKEKLTLGGNLWKESKLPARQ